MSEPPIFYMDDAIRPHRSMSRQGLVAILGVLLVFNLLITAFLFFIGAFPAPIFLGLDFAGVLIAFHVSNRRARRGDRVQVTHDEVRVIREQPKGSVTLWTSPTAFTRVEVDKEEGYAGDDGRVLSVRVRLRNRSLAVAGALGPAEQAAFAIKLQAAMRSALAERHA